MSENYTSETNVEKAILSLLTKGKNPSVDSIRGELALMLGFDEGEKKGSPNEILKVKRDWQEKVRTQLQIPTPKHIPEAVLSNFEAIWDANQALAVHEFEAEKTGLLEKIEELESSLESSLSSESLKEMRISELSAEKEALSASHGEMIDELKNKNEQLNEYLANKDEEIVRLKVLEAKLTEQSESAEKKVEEQRVTISNLRTKLEQVTNNLEGDKSKFESKITTLESKINDQAAIISSSRAEVEKINDALLESNEKLSQFKSNTLQLENDISRKNSELEHLKKDKEVAYESLRLAEDRASKESSKAESTQESYEKLMDRYSELNDKYSVLVNQVLSQQSKK